MMGYDRDAPWITCGERDDREATEEEVAKCLYGAEYDIEAYPWEKQSSAEQLTYLEQARKALRDFIMLRP